MIVHGLLTLAPPYMSLHIEIFFSSYQGDDFGKVKMGNQVSSKIVGIGHINTGWKFMLKECEGCSRQRTQYYIS